MIKHYSFLFFLLLTGVISNAQSLLSSTNDKLFSSISNPDSIIIQEKIYLSDTSKHLNDTLRIKHQLKILTAYQIKNAPDSAWLILKSFQKLLTNVDSSQCHDEDYWWIAKTYLQQNQTDKAKFWLALALARLQNTAEIERRRTYSTALSEVYKQTNDFKNAIIFQSLSDSLFVLLLQDNFKSQQDSVFALMNQLTDSLSARNKIIISKEQAYQNNLNFWMILSAVVGFLLLVLNVFFFIRGSRRKNNLMAGEKLIEQKKETVNNQPSVRVQKQKIITDITNIYGLISLMLEKPRTGEDLNYLKGLQAESFEWFTLLKSEPNNIIESLDEDVIIKKLKGIRIIIYTTNNHTALFLRDYLRKKIRLCTINVVNQLNGIDNTQTDVLIADDAKYILPEADLIPVIYLNSSNEFVKGINKPFVIDELLRKLIHIYEPQHSYQTDAVQEISKIEDVIIYSPAKELLIKLNDARDSKDRNRIIEVVAQLKPLVEQETNIKWFDSVLNHGHELNELQFEIAIRNIVTYVTKQG